MIKKLIEMFYKQETVEQMKARIDAELRSYAAAKINSNWYHQAKDRHNY